MKLKKLFCIFFILIIPSLIIFAQSQKSSQPHQAKVQTIVEFNDSFFTAGDDGFIIKGKKKLAGGTVNSYNDHRIAMSSCIASLICENEVIIKNAEAVSKSYPEFYEDMKKLGFNIEIVN